MCNLLVALLLLVTCFAHAETGTSPLVAKQIVSEELGAFRFELHNRGEGPYVRGDVTQAEISIFKGDSDKLLQKLSVEVWIESPSFDFIDLNDDGYVDLILYDDCAGFALCGGPTLGADVFMFAPKLGRFVRSETLSGRGEIKKSKNKGCIIADYKSGPAGYTDEEWCFNLKKGHWKMVHSSGGDPEGD